MQKMTHLDLLKIIHNDVHFDPIDHFQESIEIKSVISLPKNLLVVVLTSGKINLFEGYPKITLKRNLGEVSKPCFNIETKINAFIHNG